MNYKVCCFNGRILILFEAPSQYKFVKDTVNYASLRQSLNIYPNFIQQISIQLEELYKTYNNIVCILYRSESIMMNNFPNGVKNNITYYIYHTDLYDCKIDDTFYDELLSHLVDNVKMTPYVSQVFLQSLRNGFNKHDPRINDTIAEYNLQTHHDDLDEIKRMVLNLRSDQKQRIETLVSKNSTFNSILPNMLLLNVTNCIQQESLSIKHSDSLKSENVQLNAAPSSSSSLPTIEMDDDDNMDFDVGNDDVTSSSTSIVPPPSASASSSSSSNGECSDKFMSYINHCTKFKQHYYYCSYGDVVIVEAHIQLSTFNSLVLKNIILAFWVNKHVGVDQLHVYLYIDAKKFKYFSKIHIRGKILQYVVRKECYALNPEKTQIHYNIDFGEAKIFSTASMVVTNVRLSKDTFKPKIKAIQVYLIVCRLKLHIILSEWNCICKIIRIVTSPFNSKNVFYHTIVYINEYDVDFLYEFLPDIGMNSTPCLCNGTHYSADEKLPHSQKLWLTRPCVEILFHTHFDWTILKINSDFYRKPYAADIYKLYDIFEAGKTKDAKLLNSPVFRATIENLTTFKFFHETGLLYPFESSGREELYIYTLIKMMRIVYRCLVLPLSKLEKLTLKTLIPSKFVFTYAFIDDPLTPTTSVRGPQSTRNLKSIESSERMFDTKVINVTMLMNSFNLCGSEDIENSIKY